MRYAVLMVKILDRDVRCPRCTSSLLHSNGLSACDVRREVGKVYKGWHCGCRAYPDSHAEVGYKARGSSIYGCVSAVRVSLRTLRRKSCFRLSFVPKRTVHDSRSNGPGDSERHRRGNGVRDQLELLR